MQFYSEVKYDIFRRIAEIIMYGVGGMELTCCESKRSQVQIPNTHVKARHGSAWQRRPESPELPGEERKMGSGSSLARQPN